MAIEKYFYSSRENLETGFYACETLDIPDCYFALWKISRGERVVHGSFICTRSTLAK